MASQTPANTNGNGFMFFDTVRRTAGRPNRVSELAARRDSVMQTRRRAWGECLAVARLW
jgi:hypothetical protein